jgi:type I restriction enzyme, S subunit
MKKDWSLLNISDVTTIVNGGTPKTNIKEYWDGDIAWITPSDLGKLKNIIVDKTIRTISEEGLQKSSAKLFPKNSVILSTRAPIGHLAINSIPMSTNQGCRGIVPSEKLDNFYLYYFLKNNVTLLNSLGTGTTFKELSTKALGAVKIPIPPIEEQKQIVEILDKAFESIEQAKVNIEKNIENTKELFQSRLNEIFSQKSDGWEEKTLKEVCTKITDGTHQTPKYFDSGYTFLSSGNVTSGIIDWDKIKYIDEKQHLEMQKRVSPQLNDILLAKNGTTGVAAIVDKDIEFDIYVSLALLRASDKLESKYLLHFVNSPIAKKQFNKRLKGSGVPNLHLQEIREVTIPYPISKKEQFEISNYIELLSMRIKQLEKHYQRKLKNLEELKKSILQKAFRGELLK